MAYVRINSAVEYDPIARTIRQDGKVRPAGFAALAFCNILEVQQQLRAEQPAEAAAPPEPSQTPPAGVTATGAPRIVLRETPAPNCWNYAGPAAYNPYFIHPGVPMRQGLVEGYENWFQTAEVRSGPDLAYSMRVASPEGAQEALRLVQEYVPEAFLESEVFGAGGGPWTADRPSLYIALPGGGRLNAAAVLDSYYHRGQGVTTQSDFLLREYLRLPSR